MSLRRRQRSAACAEHAAGEPSRETIIPSPLPAQTLERHVKAVTLRGSGLISALSLPLFAVPEAFTSQSLPVLALFLTASHGSFLVRQSVRLR